MNASANPQANTNPLLCNWNTPYGLPPFDQIRPEHFESAFEQALRENLEEVERLASQPEAPTFANTVAAFDETGRLLARVDGVFSNLCSSETSPELQAVERLMAPRLAAHQNAVYMHEGLFRRIAALFEQRQALGLNGEDLRLLERIYLDFVRAGALLDATAKRRYAEVTERLAELTTAFGQNVLADEAGFQLVLKSEEDLAGLPAFVRSALRQAAQERGIDGYVVTLSRSLVVPFISYSSRRDLRELAYKAWVQRGEHDGPSDNRGIIKEILQLRLEQARLHGYRSYADYALSDTMAGQPAAVYELLKQAWEPAKRKAAAECEALQGMAASLDQPLQIAPWDWRYYAEKVRATRYDLDDAELKPYFSLDRMVEAMFDCASRLFGLSFKEIKGVPLYHPDVRLWEVYGRSGQLTGLFLGDNFARASKRGGAWMSAYRMQSRHGGGVLPIIVNNNNFAKGEPTLLSFDDVRTLFHEFGHGLHGLLSNVTYERLSGTSVLRDFVELPSQIYENWAMETEVLQKHARHHVTGEPIPLALIERLKEARKFNQGFETVEYAASALVDLALHQKTELADLDVGVFEREELARLGMPAEINMRHRLPHFNHLFSGSSYASAYYVYMWAEVLDADGYQAFVEAGDPFDAAVADRLYRYIYSSGNSLEPRAAFRAFRGADPSVKAMLAARGLLEVGMAG